MNECTRHGRCEDLLFGEGGGGSNYLIFLIIYMSTFKYQVFLSKTYISIIDRGLKLLGGKYGIF